MGLNKIFCPTYQNTADQTLLDSATNIRSRNYNVDTERWRDRYQANATGQYYLDDFLGARHEFKFGFDHAHAVVENHVSRIDDVEPVYSSATGRAQNVTLYAQDSFSVQRLTVTAGVRWERLEGYLPEQSSPGSRFFPALPRSFPERRDVVNWKTLGPRLSAAYDLRGDGKTALKAAVGRYYYVIAAGGGILDGVNPNANYSETYGWNDLNGDLVFQPGEQTR